jgi:hypothetical protein
VGTRSRIGILNDDKTVTSIYCHWDGYPDGVGRTLFHHYREPEKIRQLIALGDLSILGSEIGEKHAFDDRSNCDGKVCTAYGRDRGEQDIDAVTHHRNQWPESGWEYLYLYQRGRWYVRYTELAKFRTLTENEVGPSPKLEDPDDSRDLCAECGRPLGNGEEECPDRCVRAPADPSDESMFNL